MSNNESRSWVEYEDMSYSCLKVDKNFNDNGVLEFDSAQSSPYVWLTINQVKDLVSHLQRALDEHGVVQ